MWVLINLMDPETFARNIVFKLAPVDTTDVMMDTHRTESERHSMLSCFVSRSMHDCAG
jgi:hypothetical protein